MHNDYDKPTFNIVILDNFDHTFQKNSYTSPHVTTVETGEKSQSLYQLQMIDLEIDIELQRGTRPNTFDHSIIQEKVRATPNEEHAIQLKGTDFYLPLLD